MLNFFTYPHPRTFFLIVFREGGKEEGRKRNINPREKDQLLASCMGPDWDSRTQTGDPAAALLLWTTFQPTEPHRP